MSDGWRGTRLGYAGGRTGYMANYGNNDSFRGTLGANNNSSGFNYVQSGIQRNTATLMATGFGLILGLAILTGNKGLNKAINKVPVVGDLNKAVQNTAPAKAAQNTVKKFTN